MRVVGDRLRLDWLRDRIVELPRDDRWDALARNALREDVAAEHRRVAGSILATTDPGFEPVHAFEIWANGLQASLDRVLALVDDVRTHGVFDLATLSVALRELRALALIRFCALSRGRPRTPSPSPCRRRRTCSRRRCRRRGGAARTSCVMIMRAPVPRPGDRGEQPSRSRS